MNLEGHSTRFRAVEPGDVELMYVWENDTEIWGVSGTLAPFSRHTLERFVEGQQFDIFQTRQQRLIIETLSGTAIGMLDLFEVDPVNSRVGIGIMIHRDKRGKGYATDAVETACKYVHEVLHLHQVWCNVEADNAASLQLFRGLQFQDAGLKKDWTHSAAGYKDEILLQRIF